MPSTMMTSREEEFSPSLRNFSSLLTSFDSTDIISPVCLSAKNSMLSRCIVS